MLQSHNSDSHATGIHVDGAHGAHSSTIVRRAEARKLGTLPAAALLGLVLATAAGTAVAQRAASVVALEIPAQPLSTALKSLARQSGVQMFFDEDLVAGFESASISGTM